MKPEFTDRWRQRLLAAQIDLIDECGGCKRVVEKTSYSRTQVGRWYGGVDRDFIPMPIVLQLEADCERPIVTLIMAEFHGRELSEGEQGGSAMNCLASLNAELVELSGQMMVETVRAKSDGMVTPNEATRLREYSRRVERIRAQIDALLAGKVAGEAGLKVVGGGE